MDLKQLLFDFTIFLKNEINNIIVYDTPIDVIYPESSLQIQKKKLNPLKIKTLILLLTPKNKSICCCKLTCKK